MHGRPVAKISFGMTQLMIILAILGPTLRVFSIGGANIFLFRLLLPLYGVVLIVTALDESRCGNGISLPWSIILLLVFAILCLVSTGWAGNTESAVSGLARVLGGILLAVGIVQTTSDDRHLQRLMSVLYLLGVMSIVVYLGEVTLDTHLSTSNLVGHPNRPPYTRYGSAWFYNINDLAMFLTIASAYPIALAMTGHRNYSTRILHLGVASAFLGVVYLNNARAGIIGIVIIAVACVSVRLLEQAKCGRWILDMLGNHRVVTSIVLLIMGLLLAGVGLLSNPFTDGSLYKRWNFYAAGVDVGTSRMIGAGIGQSQYAIANTHLVRGEIASPHSWFGAVLAELGFGGLVLLLSIYALVLSGALRARSTEAFSVGILGALIGFPIAGLGPSNAFYMPTFWLTLAVGMALEKVRPHWGSRTAEEPVHHPRTDDRSH